MNYIGIWYMYDLYCCVWTDAVQRNPETARATDNDIETL